MYAVIEAGSKQHRVALGEKLLVDLMADKKKGDLITFDNVLMVQHGDGYKVGKPFVPGAKVQAKVTYMGNDGEGFKGEKLYVFKMKRRKGFHKTIGHRQRYTEITITSIEA